MLVQHIGVKKNINILGRKQAEWTGKRLKELNMPYTEIVKSTMARAQETADIITSSLPNVPTKSCKLLEEGAPIPPIPEVGHWKPENYVSITCFPKLTKPFIPCLTISTGEL